MAAILNQGITEIRDAVAGAITHLGVAEDTTAFNASQTTLIPGGGAFFTTAVTKTNENSAAKNYTATVTSDDFGDKDVATIGLLTGSAATDAISRNVRTRTLGIQAANDSYTLTVRLTHTDTTA